MLPRQHRLNRSADLRNCFRRGRRFGVSGGSINVLKTDAASPTRIGVVTPKLVGNSVVRHAVARKIRHAAANVIEQYPNGFDIAVRAIDKSAENQLNYWESEILSAIEKLQFQVKKPERIDV
ncbi:MAG: ribonuclease protein component [Actinomycetota bacterium]